MTAALSTALTEAAAIQLADAYQAAHPPDQRQGQKKRDLVAAAALWLSLNGPDIAAILAPLAPGIIADGWLIGGTSARAMTGGGEAGTGKWKPGGTDAATAQAGALGLGLGPQLQAAQAQAGQSAQAMASGYRTALGRALVEGATGAALIAVLTDAARAAAAVLGQLTAAISAAASAWYRQQQVEWCEWAGADDDATCPECLMNQQAGPVRFGSPFPSGDISPPIHPHDRCALVPSRAP